MVEAILKLVEPVVASVCDPGTRDGVMTLYNGGQLFISGGNYTPDSATSSLGSSSHLIDTSTDSNSIHQLVLTASHVLRLLVGG